VVFNGDGLVTISVTVTSRHVSVRVNRSASGNACVAAGALMPAARTGAGCSERIRAIAGPPYLLPVGVYA